MWLERDNMNFFIEQKIEARINEIKRFRYRESLPVENFLCLEDFKEEVNPMIPSCEAEWKPMHIKESWSGRDKYLWLKMNLTIPKAWNGRKVVGVFDFGITGDGNNSGFESLLYIQQKPYQGVDVNHQEVFLKEEFIGEDIEFIFRLWSGLEGGGEKKEQVHQIKVAEVAWLDEKVDDFYYLTYTILETIKVLKENNPLMYELRTVLNESFHKIDWSIPGSDSFYVSIDEADQYLNQAIDKMDSSSRIKVKCIGHTHIDVAWLWRLKHTREKCSRSFSTVLRLMELYPEYIFLQTQPQLYEYIKQDFPDIYESIKTKVKDGKWEVDGGMWVEADCNLTSGESLTRQIMMCQKFMLSEFNCKPNYLWLPDVFGYSWALPQILKKSGIDMFMTTKISWNQYNRMPHDTFYWTGMDGTKILTHFITTPAPWSEEGSWFYTYNGLLTPFTVQGVWNAYQDKNLNQELLVSYGYGDGGGGVNRDMLEMRRRIDKIPGLPKLESSKASEYFGDLKERVKESNQYVHEWDGELYLEYHRGTYTSQAYNKRMNRKMEYLYREVEYYILLANIISHNMDNSMQTALWEGWKILLTHQFHDIIPGSSIHEVYEDSKINYEKAFTIAMNIMNDCKKYMMEETDNALTVINFSTWNREGLIEIDSHEEINFYSMNHEKLESQKTDMGYLVYLENIEATESKVIYKKNEKRVDDVQNHTFQHEQFGVSTPFYNIRWNKNGQITQIFDKEAEVEIIPKGERANVFQLFEDKPLGNDAWDIDIFYQEKMNEIDYFLGSEIIEQGNLRTKIKFTWEFHNSKIIQEMILYRYNRRIDFSTYINFNEHKKLLKVAFPVDIRTTYATYDVQYGNVRRENHWNTSWNFAKFETVAHRFADLSEHNYGVSLMNDCKYGYDVKGNCLRLSLIKSATHPDPMQDIGEHLFTYSLFPHKGDFIQGKTVQSAYDLNHPLRIEKGSISQNIRQLVRIDNDYIELDAIKIAESGDGFIIRFHEFCGSKQQVTISFGIDVKGFLETNLMEEPLEELQKNSVIKTKVRPYEIKTYKVIL